MPPAEHQDQPVEIVTSFANGAVVIEKTFDLENNCEVEHLNVLGVRIRRRNPEQDGLPGYSGKFDISKITLDKPTVCLLRDVLMRQAIGHHTMLLGDPEYGKSTIAELVAYLLNVPFEKVQCHVNMDFVHDVIKDTKEREGGGYTGGLGKLPRMMQEGGIILFDELPNVPPEGRQPLLEVTSSPNSRVAPSPPSLDMGGYLGKETTVVAKPGFFICGTGNYREGQGAGEISAFTDREERRFRPLMLDKLQRGTKAKRMAGRYRSVPMQTDITTVSTLPRHRYYPPYLSGMTDNITDTIGEFFEEVHEVILAEVLPGVRQDPRVFLREIIDRVNDHFMRFQIQLEGGSADPKIRLQEMLESAADALEFYYINTFRDTTKIKLPDANYFREVTGVAGVPVQLEAFKDGHGRVPVRTFLLWRIQSLFSTPFWEIDARRVNVKQRLAQLLNAPEEPSEISAAVRAAIENLAISLNAPVGAPPATVVPPGPGVPPAAEPPAMEPPEGPDPDVPALDDTVPDDIDGMFDVEILMNLEAQYGERLKTLQYFGIVADTQVLEVLQFFGADTANPAITDIAGQQRPAPTFAEIQSKLLTPEFLQKIRHFKHPMLLVTPIGMSLKELAEKVGGKRGRLPAHNPVNATWDLDADKTGELVYFPQQYEKNNHGGVTKAQLLAQNGGKNIFPGWQVTVVEGMDEIDTEAIKIQPPPTDPNASESKNAHQFLQEIKNGGLSGLMPEEWLVLHAEGVRRGKPFESESWTWLLAAYHKALGAVPHSDFGPGYARANVRRDPPELSLVVLGVRRAARE